jgi:hypothetical protein
VGGVAARFMGGFVCYSLFWRRLLEPLNLLQEHDSEEEKKFAKFVSYGAAELSCRIQHICRYSNLLKAGLLNVLLGFESPQFSL